MSVCLSLMLLFLLLENSYLTENIEAFNSHVVFSVLSSIFYFTAIILLHLSLRMIVSLLAVISVVLSDLFAIIEHYSSIAFFFSEEFKLFSAALILVGYLFVAIAILKLYKFLPIKLPAFLFIKTKV